ncbi:MAG: ABC transporter substrate-binding protein [Lachnospiraceae bacterium]
MKKKLVAILLVMTIVLSAVGCGSKTDDKKTTDSDHKLKKITMVLDWTPNTNHTGLYVAQANDYFKDAGLEVEIVQPPEDGAEALVASGKAQFGVSFQDSMAPALTGDAAMPITAVAALIQHNTSGIISRKGEGMNTPKGMEGKKYATWDLEVEKAMIRSVVEADGGDYQKIEMIPSTITDEISALETKSIDAVWIYYAWTGLAAKVKGLDTDYFAFRDIDPVFDYYTPVVISNNDFLKEDPDTAKAFLSALAKGYEFAMDEPNKAADILCKASPELDKDIVLESQKWLANEYKSEVTQWGYMDAARWNSFYNWLNENKLINPAIPENTGFTNDYLPTEDPK